MFDDKGAPVRFQVNRDVFSEAVSFVVKLLPSAIRSRSSPES